MPQPRRHRLRRPARLQSARSWLESGGEATVRVYARRYGVDRYTAYDELRMLGVTPRAKDAHWAQRPPAVPKRPKPPRRTKGEPDWPDDGLGNDGLPYGWMEWGGELLFVAGFTSGGAPFGVRIEEFPPEDLPEELKELAEVRRAQAARLSSVYAQQGARDGEDCDDDRDVPF